MALRSYARELEELLLLIPCGGLHKATLVLSDVVQDKEDYPLSDTSTPL